MGVSAWLTLLVVVFLLVGLVRNLAPPDVLFVGATAFLAVCGIITPEQAFAGFANPGVLTVAALFVVAAGLRETGVLDLVGHRVLGRARTERGVVARLAALLLPLSAFLNNTPVVALAMPMVLDWCRRHQVTPSRVLIPLSYFAILGGTCTLIGTSTNLVINGLMVQAGMPGMGLFEITWVGVPYALVGTAYLMTVGRHLLPERKELLEQLGESRREYLAEMEVQPGCRMVGQTVETAGLRHLPGLFLIEIDRNGALLAPVGPDDVISAGDRLVFTGVVDSIVGLQSIAGLVPVADPSYDLQPGRGPRRQMCEVVISPTSPLIGKTVRDADFRAAYGAAVVAVHRGGARLTGKVGDVWLLPGDTLLLQTRPHFQRAHRNDPAFYLVSDVPDWRPLRRERAWLALALLAAFVVVLTGGLLPVAVSAVLAAVLMVGLGCISPGDARQSIEWQVLLTIAAAFGVGAALTNSGAAAAVAGALVDTVRVWGPVAALAGIYLLTLLLTEMITNNAVAVLMFPLCVETARLYDVSARPFLIALVLAASASFMTPIGYQTNMMVYGPGGYRFGDFLRVGTPLSFLLMGVAVVLVPWLWAF